MQNSGLRGLARSSTRVMRVVTMREGAYSLKVQAEIRMRRELQQKAK